MALLTHPSSPSSSSSHPSSPEAEHPDMDTPSVEQDASLATALAAVQTSEPDNVPGSSRHSPPQPSPTELARIRSTGRGGCWTCRVRRKKCDEERVDGGSCKTCRRLGLECLGWGPRRPDWMRDKEKVAQYKADIKAQLTRAGLIRGQPRSVYSTIPPSTSVGQPSASSSSSGRYAPGSSSLRPPRSEEYSTYVQGYDHARFHHATNTVSGMSGLDPLSATTSPDLALPATFVLSNAAFNQPALPYSNEMGALSAGAAAPYPPFLHTPEIAPSITPGMRDSPFNEQPEPYIQYYFEHVRKIQFPLAGKDLTQTLGFILQAEPQGPLEYAICALASLHSARAAAAQTGAAENPERSVDRRFYNKAYVMLMGAKATGRPYNEHDAVAAVFLISYHNLAGGGTGWTALLEVAYEWVAQTGIAEEQNPKLALVNMTPVQKLAAKATMWIDVLSAIVFARAPRFLTLYRQLFGPSAGSGYWATANNDQLDLRMDKLTGCPDEAVLALAEAAQLASWKAAEAQKGTLSVRELVLRGDTIEQTLRAHPSRASYAESPTAEGTPLLPTGMPAAAGAELSPALGASSEHDRRIIASIWRETAVLYLHTIVNDPQPGVPEIVKGTNLLIDQLNTIPPSDFHYAIILPYILTGCMSNDPMVFEIVKNRLLWHRDDFFNGSMSQGRTFIEYFQSRRMAMLNTHRASVPVDWRECIRERWSAVPIA